MEDNKYEKEDILLYGGAKKELGKMNSKERKIVSEKIGDSIREKAFSRGLPIYVEIDGKTVAEYADGKKEIL